MKRRIWVECSRCGKMYKRNVETKYINKEGEAVIESKCKSCCQMGVKHKKQITKSVVTTLPCKVYTKEEIEEYLKS